MKRLSSLFAALALTAVVALLPHVAAAQNAAQFWDTKEINWRLTRQVGGTTNVLVKDTTYAHVGGTNAQVADTTGWFTLDGLSIASSMGNHSVAQGGASSTLDSTLVAIVTVVQDSIVDATPNITVVPYLIQLGREQSPGTGTGAQGFAPNLTGATTFLAATTTTISSGDRIFQIPIYVSTQALTSTGIVNKLGVMPNGLTQIRVIIPAATFTGTTGYCGARAFVSWPRYNGTR